MPAILPDFHIGQLKHNAAPVILPLKITKHAGMAILPLSTKVITMGSDGLSKKDAEALRKRVINTLSESEANIRSVLTEAIRFNAYKPLGFPSFEKYACDCITKAGVSMSSEYARRQAKAGLVELVLEIEIGSMPEGALRPLHENVKKSDCKRVFELACENLKKGKYPTRSQIVNAAKYLDCFKEQKGKKKLSNIIVSEEPNSDEDDAGDDFDAVAAEDVQSNAYPIKGPRLSKVFADLTQNLALKDVKRVRNFITAWQKPELKSVFETVIEADPMSVKKLRAQLSKFIKKAEDEANTDKSSA